jgi:hypothetical protein
MLWIETEAHKRSEQITDVQISAADGAALKGWLVTPQDPNGRAVILFHGVTDTRAGVAGYAQLFLDHQYTVLLPDARAHGESGGDLATYGVREAGDIARWSVWLRQRTSGCVYGFGESMGAALVLQSLREDPHFCGVVAESPFSDFREAAYDRVSQTAHIPRIVVSTLGVPAVETGIQYAKARYGVDFDLASPRVAVASSRTPVLLIHGLDDRNLRPENSVRIQKARADVELWEVPYAGHCGVWIVEGQKFDQRVLDFLARHTGSI